MNPTLLLWALPALPVIIHLIRLQVKRKYVFSSTAFLQKFLESQGWLTKLLRWLVLAMRVGFMAMLVYYLYTNFFVADSAREKVVLFIDNSASSLARVEGKSVLEEHKTRAADKVLSLNPNSSVSVLTNNTATHNLSPEEAAVEIASIRPFYQKPELDRANFSTGDRLIVFTDGGGESLAFANTASSAIKNRILVPEVVEGQTRFTLDSAWLEDKEGRTFVHFQTETQGIKRLAIKINEVIVAYQTVMDGANAFRAELRGTEPISKIEVVAPDAAHQEFYATILNKPIKYRSVGVTNRYVAAFLTYNRLFTRSDQDPDFEIVEWSGQGPLPDLQGRNVLVYPAANVSGQSYASLLTRSGIAAQPLPSDVSPEGYEVDPASSQPILSRILLRKENPSASYPFFRPIVNALAAEGALARTLNGYPIVLERTIDNHRVHFLTGPLGSNANLQNSNLFAPILYQLLVRKESSQLKYAWLDDDKTLMADNLFSDSLQPGFSQTGGEDAVPVGLNIPRSETRPIGEEAIQKLEKAGWKVETGKSFLPSGDSASAVFPYLLMLGLILAAVEVVLLTRTFNANPPKEHPAGARPITATS